ncbi:MAG: ATP-binding cassette domain-containing protein [bacterium]
MFNLSILLPQMSSADISAGRIFDLLKVQSDIKDPVMPKSVDLTVCKGRVVFEEVAFRYGGKEGPETVKNISFVAEPGQTVALLGTTGAGKSSLVHLIPRFYDPTGGRVTLDGVDVRNYDVETLRRHIGDVLQEPFLFHETVARNIAYGNPGATLERIIAASKAANAHDFIVSFPDGYDTLIGERGHTLSGGERQRISIARAILSDPAILILDEATSSVDTQTEKLIQEALARLVANRTTIAIAHRLSTLRKADHLVVLDKGKIIEQGSHDELAALPDGTYAKLLRLQSEMQSIIAIG